MSYLQGLNVFDAGLAENLHGVGFDDVVLEGRKGVGTACCCPLNDPGLFTCLDYLNSLLMSRFHRSDLATWPKGGCPAWASADPCGHVLVDAVPGRMASLCATVDDARVGERERFTV